MDDSRARDGSELADDSAEYTLAVTPTHKPYCISFVTGERIAHPPTCQGWWTTATPDAAACNT